MAPQKETMMALNVDLDCNRCYTKVKRTLCQFPQVQDQIYNDKQNTVIIKVVCCSPEKIMDKIFAKGGKSIKDIKILEPKKPPPPADKPKDPPPTDSKPKQPPPADTKPPKQADSKPPKEADNKPPKDAPPVAAKPPQADDKPAKKNVTFKPDGQPAKPQGDGAAKPQKEAAAPPPAAAQKPAGQALMAPMVPSMYGYGYPVNVGCLDCYEGRMCYHHTNGFGYGYGTPAPPPPPAGGYGYGYGYGVPPPPPPAYGYKPGYCVSRYGDYVSDENASGCVVM